MEGGGKKASSFKPGLVYMVMFFYLNEFEYFSTKVRSRFLTNPLYISGVFFSLCCFFCYMLQIRAGLGIMKLFIYKAKFQSFIK